MVDREPLFDSIFSTAKTVRDRIAVFSEFTATKASLRMQIDPEIVRTRLYRSAIIDTGGIHREWFKSEDCSGLSAQNYLLMTNEPCDASS
jgi:hypothetical protein